MNRCLILYFVNSNVVFLSEYRRVVFGCIERVLLNFLVGKLTVIAIFLYRFNRISTLCNFLVGLEWIFKFTLDTGNIFDFALILVKLRGLLERPWLVLVHLTYLTLGDNTLKLTYWLIGGYPSIKIGLVIFILGSTLLVYLRVLRLHLIKEILWIISSWIRSFNIY